MSGPAKAEKVLCHCGALVVDLHPKCVRRAAAGDGQVFAIVLPPEATLDDALPKGIARMSQSERDRILRKIQTKVERSR